MVINTNPLFKFFYLAYSFSFVFFMLPIQRNITVEAILLVALLSIFILAILSIKKNHVFIASYLIILIISLILNSTSDVYRVGIEIKIIVAIIAPMLFVYVTNTFIDINFFIKLILFAGIYFSIYELYYIYSFGYESLEANAGRVRALLYDPAKMFVQLYLLLQGLHLLSLSKVTKGLLLIVTSIAFTAPAVFAPLRYSIFIFIFSIFLYLIKLRGVVRKLSLLLVLLLIYLALFDEINSAIQLSLYKSQHTGASVKLNALYEILSNLNNPQSILFGAGLGSEFFNPSYRGYRYIPHSLFAFFLIKVGVLGLFIWAYILYTAIKLLLFSLSKRCDYEYFIIIVPLFFVVINGLFLQTTYAYYSYFGILFALFSMSKFLNKRLI
jgi:hypothetical protein